MQKKKNIIDYSIIAGSGLNIVDALILPRRTPEVVFIWCYNTFLYVAFFLFPVNILLRNKLISFLLVKDW